MISNVVTLPTARTSYFTVRKSKKLWAVCLVTPVKGSKAIITRVAQAHTYEAAIAYVEKIATAQQLPWIGGVHELLPNGGAQ